MLASSPPADNLEATSHGPAGPNRSTHALAATAIASNASATSPPAGSIAPSSGSNATAQRVKCARIGSARSANRRSQPRTVSGYAPTRAAIRRNPSPATTFASIASPITDTSSWRRENASSGSNTCVPKQPRQRARRGRTLRSPARQRSTRSLACPHGPNTSRHDGHANSPPTNSASTNATSAHTINIGVPPPASKRALPTTINQTGGLSRVQNTRSLPNPATTTNGTITPTRDQTQRRLTFVQAEPWLTRDKAMIDTLKSVGIEKGKPFTPDQRTEAILRNAVEEAHAWLDQKYEEVFASVFFDGARWAVPASREVIEGQQTFFADPGTYPVDGRGVSYSYAFFSAKHLGAGQFYLMTITDKDGQPFHGTSTYRLTIPPTRPSASTGQPRSMTAPRTR